MENDFLFAMLGGLVGTTFMTSMMLFGRHLNLPAVDAHGILGFVQQTDHASPLGYVMHWLMGAIFALGYVFVFQSVEGNPIILGTAVGIIHWILVGWAFAFAPLIHAGMKAGKVPETGAYMLKSLGFIGFIAGMVGHIVFGISVALTYAWLGGTFAG